MIWQIFKVILISVQECYYLKNKVGVVEYKKGNVWLLIWVSQVQSLVGATFFYKSKDKYIGTIYYCVGLYFTSYNPKEK